jgi:hypothetical protein
VNAEEGRWLSDQTSLHVCCDRNPSHPFEETTRAAPLMPQLMHKPCQVSVPMAMLGCMQVVRAVLKPSL